MADDPILEKPVLPIWLNKNEIVKLAAATHKWFLKLAGWAKWPLMQLDPLKCAEPALDLLAFQRDITRFKGEPLNLYRLRVNYAYINAKDAGSVAGFKRIFTRLEIGYVEIEERQEGLDWDVINIVLTDSQLAKNEALLETLIQHYGRTCRRYGWRIATTIDVGIVVADFSNNSATVTAELDESDLVVAAGERVVNFSNDTATAVAQEVL